MERKYKKKKPEVFAMKAMIFGAACSPSSAQEAKNRNATEFRIAVDAILHKHYVMLTNWIVSVPKKKHMKLYRKYQKFTNVGDLK